MLEEPAIVKQGSKYGVRIKATAPSIHMIRANIQTEIAPIVGTEQQAQDLLRSTQQQCAAMEQQARSKADYYWESLSQKIQQLYQQQPPELPVIEEAPLSSEEDTCFGPDD